MLRPDYPHIRASRACPLCWEPKNTGLIVCWPCYRIFDAKHGFEAHTRMLIDATETALGEADRAKRAV